MMLPSTAAARDIPTGLGQAVSQATIDAIKADKPVSTSGFPSWCSWMPFADYLPACRVPTAAEQNAAIKADIEKAAGAGTPAYNPDLAAEQYQEYLKDATSYCASHPEECAAYKQAGESPTCSAMLGTGTVAQTFCANPGGYLLLGAAAIAGILLWGARR